MLDLSYGGGIILISSARERSDGNYVTFINCSFSNNRANEIVTITFKVKSSNNQQVESTGVDFFKESVYGKGGALSFCLWIKEVFVDLTIKDCFIYENKAVWDSGVCIEFDKSTETNILIFLIHI